MNRVADQLISGAIRTVERLPLPDPVTLAGIDYLVGRTDRALRAQPRNIAREFARTMAAFPIAVHADDDNAQHYEIPPEFFRLILGPRRKYSCCLYTEPTTTLAEAENLALSATARHADLGDGQRILELGCGWGSLSLWMAERFPGSEITAVSNSHSQKSYIAAEAARRGVTNLSVITADMNDFSSKERFDRVVSVEMFEHMANWRSLLSRVRTWLAPGGKLFLHVFTHETTPYRFDHQDPSDWIGRHFFTGGLMPSHELIREFADLFACEKTWRWSGEHYRRTAVDWLANFDRNRGPIDEILANVYGGEAALWRRRWRLFFLATAGLFGHEQGTDWGVSHYLLNRRDS